MFTSPTEFTVQPLTKPELAIRLVGNSVELSWPTTATGWILESATDLSAGAAWAAVAAAPVTIGDRKIVTEVLAGPRRFYRLRKP